MKTLRQNNSGQALLELALIMPMLMIFVFGIVDYTRAIYDQEVITNLAGEGSSMASRGGGLAATVAAVWSDADIDMADNGCVIVTSVASPSSGSYKVTGQAYSTVCNSASQQDWLFSAAIELRERDDSDLGADRSTDEHKPERVHHRGLFQIFAGDSGRQFPARQ